MVALISVLVIVLLYVLITRVATVALSLTGMSRESARFQARSALTGVGFTTSEAEDVVAHPVRRRIVGGLMLVGGLALLWVISRSSWVDRRLSSLIGRVLRWRGYDVRDYGRLLALQADWAVSELVVEPDDWIAGRTLAELRLRDEDIDVLGIQKPNGEYIGVPHGQRQVEPGDVLVLYSTEERLEELDERKHGRAGDEAHRQAADESDDANALVESS
jgi:hypothetical protein